MSKKIFVVAVLVSVVAGYIVAPIQQARAVLGVGDVDFNTEIANPYDIALRIGLAAAEQIATNYINNYLQRFINQLQDKYRIQNFMAYTQVLTDHYLTDYLRTKISDPDLRSIFTLLDATYIQGTPTGYTGGINPRNALIPQLKRKMVDYYVKQGGIDPNFISNPPPGTSGSDYYSAAMSYYLNNPSFLEIALAGQIGEIQASASQAASQEIAGGNGYKASRSKTTIAGPDTGTASQIIDAIQDPASFVQDFSSTAISTIFGTNFNENGDIFSKIGSLLGDYIYNKLNINNQNSAYVLNENGNSYTYSGGTTVPKEIDQDGDQIPEGQDSNNDGKLDTCYHGGTPPNCNKSSTSTTSTYFLPFCEALDRAQTQVDSFLTFVQTYGPDAFRDKQHLADKLDSSAWSRKTAVVQGSIEALVSAEENYGISYFDTIDLAVSRYSNYMENVTGSIIKDADLDLKTGPGLGEGGGLDALISNTKNMSAYLSSIQVAMGGCSAANAAAVAQVPAPVITAPDPGTDGGTTSADCATDPAWMACSSANHKDLVQRVIAYLQSKGVNMSGDCGAFEITKRVAWALQSQGVGLISKGGTNCNGFSTDKIAFTDKSTVDILGDAGGSNGPQWLPEPSNPSVVWVPPSDPGDPPGSY